MGTTRLEPFHRSRSIREIENKSGKEKEAFTMFCSQTDSEFYRRRFYRRRFQGRLLIEVI